MTDSRDWRLLPETTQDERSLGWGEADETNDDRLLADRPPHWSP